MTLIKCKPDEARFIKQVRSVLLSNSTSEIIAADLPSFLIEYNFPQPETLHGALERITASKEAISYICEAMQFYATETSDIDPKILYTTQEAFFEKHSVRYQDAPFELRGVHHIYHMEDYLQLHAAKRMEVANRIPPSYPNFKPNTRSTDAEIGLAFAYTKLRRVSLLEMAKLAQMSGQMTAGLLEAVPRPPTFKRIQGNFTPQ